jgi:hypothetical protein
MWANEQEAAVFSGMPIDRFRLLVREWEFKGFPRINPHNGKRSIPAILAFWSLPTASSTAQLDVNAVLDEEDDGEERWHG